MQIKNKNKKTAIKAVLMNIKLKINYFHNQNFEP